jgi:hypothetical protein
MLRRLILAVALVPNLTGCLAYAFPDIVYTPQQPIDNETGGAHAFRVDIDMTERKPKPSTVEFTLMRIPIDRGGLVPSQLEVAPATGVWDPLHVGNGAEHESNRYTMTVRLYRPGYETKELKAWDKARTPKWAPARDLLSQEKAVDDLLAVPGGDGKSNWWDQKDKPSFQPGTVSKAQRDSLLFVSNQYQDLARSPAAGAANMAAVKERLQQKAIFLQRFADPMPTPVPAHLTPYRIHGGVGPASSSI